MENATNANAIAAMDDDFLGQENLDATNATAASRCGNRDRRVGTRGAMGKGAKGVAGGVGRPPRGGGPPPPFRWGDNN